MGCSKIESDTEEEEFNSEVTESGSDSDDSLTLSEELEDKSDDGQDSRVNRVLRKSSMGKNNEKNQCNKPRRSVPRRASAAKVSYTIPDLDEEDENESQQLLPPKKKVKKEEGGQNQPVKETKQKLKKIQHHIKQQPTKSNGKGATISVWPLQNADKLAAILAKAQKAKKKEIAVVGNVKAVEKNNDINCSKRGKDSDPAKKTKEMSLFQAADAEKEDEEWAEEESSLEDEEEEDFVTEGIIRKNKTTSQKRSSTLRGNGGIRRTKSNDMLSNIIIRDDTEDEIEKKFQDLQDKLTRSMDKYETKFGAGGTLPVSS